MKTVILGMLVLVSVECYAGAVDSFPQFLRDGVHAGFNAVEPYDDCEITLRRSNGEVFLGLKTTSLEGSQIIKNNDEFEPLPLYTVKRWLELPSVHRRIVKVFKGDPESDGTVYGIVTFWDWYPSAPEKNSLVQCAIKL